MTVGGGVIPGSPGKSTARPGMSRCLAVFLVVAGAFAQASEGPGTGTPCSDAWYSLIEENVPTGDGRGHGPDIGSDEWRSVVEFRLGIRGEPDLPSRDSEAWCHRIDQMVLHRRTSSRGGEDTGTAHSAQGPSFPCDGVATGSVEALICTDGTLAALDRNLADVYAAAAGKAVDEHSPVLKAEQRGWIEGRDDCWKSEDERGCVRDAYRHRIAELQARYRLVPGIGPVRFICDDDPANAVVATFFQTDPPTLVAERGDSVSLMFQQPSGSGIRYQGRNETFREHQGEAMITWGYGAPAMRCVKTPRGAEEQGYRPPMRRLVREKEDHQ
jgi:uncharacterized protein